MTTTDLPPAVGGGESKIGFAEAVSVRAVHPGSRRDARVDDRSSHPRHHPRNGLRRFLAVPGSEGRSDCQRFDSRRSHLDHALQDPLQARGRVATILENNIVQTAGGGESIAFGVGVTLPAIIILGFNLEIGRVTIVAVLGGLLGILMMIPLRRALIVKSMDS